MRIWHIQGPVGTIGGCVCMCWWCCIVELSESLSSHGKFWGEFRRIMWPNFAGGVFSLTKSGTFHLLMAGPPSNKLRQVQDPALRTAKPEQLPRSPARPLRHEKRC